MISITIFIRSWGLRLPILRIIKTKGRIQTNGNGPENSFFYDKTLFNHQNRRVGMENHPTGNAGIKQACKDVPLVI